MYAPDNVNNSGRPPYGLWRNIDYRKESRVSSSTFFPEKKYDFQGLFTSVAGNEVEDVDIGDVIAAVDVYGLQ